MIHPVNLENLSKEFYVSIGMLVWDGTEVEESTDIPEPPEVNRIIIRSIENGNYNDIRREVLRLERNQRKNTSELTTYKKAIKSEIGAKSGEVFQTR